jgi:hypothetical protein
MLFRQTIRTFIYVDSQPLTEFGSLPPCEEFSRPKFTMDVYHKMKQYGFKKCLGESTDNLDVYMNTKRGTEMYYFKNQRFPHSVDYDCIEAISKASILFCCGYMPNEKIIDMMKPGPITFIGDNKTVYRYAEGEDDSNLVKILNDCPKIFESFIRFDIPKTYKWWANEVVEEWHVANFKVTNYSSLQELYNTSH